MTTFIPRDSYSQDEIDRLYPKDLSLQQVQVLLRHGERTPVSARFKNAGLSPYWPYCQAAKHLRDVIKLANDDWDSLAYRRQLETFNGIDDSATPTAGPRGETDSICLPGELTDIGRATTLALGGRLRKLYVDQLGFLTPDIQNTDHMYIRSTPIPRALESVQQAFSGLYPPNTRAPGFSPPTIVTRQAHEETLFPNEAGCRRFSQLSQAFGQRTADRWNDSPDMAYLNSLFGKWMPEDSKTVQVDSHPRLSGIMDTINSTLAHGKETRLPKEFYDKKGREIVEKIGCEEWFSGFKESREYREVGIGGLVGDIVSRMVENTRSGDQDSKSLRFALSGCHDTTLAALLSSMGAFDGEPWPPYTSHVAVELFKAHSTPTNATTWWKGLFPAKSILTPTPSPRTPVTSLSASEKQKLDGYFVRLRYNDRIMKVPGCRPAGKHYGDDESLCTLAEFKSIADKFTPKNWKKSCGENLGKASFPETLEPAGI